MATPASSIPRLERFFREAASLDVDKDDLKRFDDFVNHKIADMLVRAEGIAKANIRDIIEPWDLPITKGLQERIHDFEKLDADVQLEPILERMTRWPQLDLGLSEETEERLPIVAGGIGIAVAKAFPLIDSNVKNPQTWHWERAVQLFDLLL